MLWYFDGQEWSRADLFRNTAPSDLRVTSDTTISYEVLMEPTEQRWWFPLDFVVEALRRESRFLRGPEAATALLRTKGLVAYGRQTLADGIELYPAVAFSPCPWFETPRPEQVTAETFCVHHWGESWRHGGEDQALL